MKKITFTLMILCAFLINNINAQIMVGPKIGLNFSKSTNLTDPSTGKNVMNMGPVFGGVLNVGINDMFSIQPELLYVVKGDKYKNGSDYIKENGNFFEVPILVKASFGKEKFKGFVNLGPYFGYLMSGKTISKISGNKSDEKYKFDDYKGTNPDLSTYTAKTNRMDIGLAAGAGVLYKVGPGNVLAELRYDMGLTNQTKYDGTKPSGVKDHKYTALSLSFGYLFTLGGK